MSVCMDLLGSRACSTPLFQSFFICWILFSGFKQSQAKIPASEGSLGSCYLTSCFVKRCKVSKSAGAIN